MLLAFFIISQIYCIKIDTSKKRNDIYTYMTVSCQILGHIWQIKLKNRKMIRGSLCPGLFYCFLKGHSLWIFFVLVYQEIYCFGSVHENTGFWKMHRSAYRVQLPEKQLNANMRLDKLRFCRYSSHNLKSLMVICQSLKWGANLPFWHKCKLIGMKTISWIH